MQQKIYSKLSAWDRVQVARHSSRPLLKDYIDSMFSEFIELHGDRCFGDDQGIIGGFATLDDIKVMLIGHQKGKDTKENLMRNFGSAHPEGYRKAMRLMRMAEKFDIPIVTFIDTPGAYPGIGAEERGQAEAIAYNLREMMMLKVPIMVIVIGEGGSGGALAICVGDRIDMLQYATYSVISPEGCASILWKSAEKAPQAAEAMGITAERLFELKLVDNIIEEPLGGAHRNYSQIANTLKHSLIENIETLESVSLDKLLDQRYQKLMKFGQFKES